MTLRYALASACGAAALFGSIPASADTYVGPVYPPPGGVTFSTNGIQAINPGRVATYQNFDLSATDELYFGIVSAGLAMDGFLNPGEMLTFDAANSNLANGIAQYAGITTLSSFGNPQTVYTRLTLTFQDLATSNALALTTNAAIGGGLIPVLNVAGSFKVGQSFTASNALNGAYTSAANFYFNTPGTPNISEPIKSGISGGFFYSENQIAGVPEPATWALLLVGFGAVGVGMRRRKAGTPRLNCTFA